MWDDKQIDAAIEETARQMTAGEPGADFRVRVMARLDTNPRSTRMWGPVFAGVTVAALIVIAMFVSRPPTPIESPVSQPAPVASGTASSRAPMEIPAPRNAEARVARVAQGFLGPPKRGTQGGGPAIAALKGCATTDCDGDALELPAIDLDSIAVAALAAADSIAIEPLPPTPSIAVTPLDVENEGDPR